MYEPFGEKWKKERSVIKRREKSESFRIQTGIKKNNDKVF